jgi:cytochrome c-type biogenesis protein CcmI
LTVLYLAALLIVLGVALFVAAPLFSSQPQGEETRSSAELARLEHERAVAVQGLRELEFDRQMRKVSDEDWATLRAVLEQRALAAMSGIEKLAARAGARPRRLPVAAVAPALDSWSFCPCCGARLTPEARFCAQCGAAVALRERA